MILCNFASGKPHLYTHVALLTHYVIVCLTGTEQSSTAQRGKTSPYDQLLLPGNSFCRQERHQKEGADNMEWLKKVKGSPMNMVLVFEHYVLPYVHVLTTLS
jgi:hypothetical protein